MLLRNGDGEVVKQGGGMIDYLRLRYLRYGPLIGGNCQPEGPRGAFEPPMKTHPGTSLPRYLLGTQSRYLP